MRASAGRIFPLDEASRKLHDVAWGAYLLFCWPGALAFEILQAHYRLAVSRLLEPKTEGRRREDLDERLGCHLVYLCGQGVVAVDNEILRSFFAKAPDELRSKVVAFVGRSLKDQKAEGLGSVLPRFKGLWEWRMSEIGKEAIVEKHRRELAAFGWWFGSDKFDDEWAVEMILRVLRLAKHVEADFFVTKRLVRIVDSKPEVAVECFRLMVEGARNEWEPEEWRDDLRKVLGAAIQGSNPTARENAIEVVHRLGAMRHFEYRELLAPGEARPSH